MGMTIDDVIRYIKDLRDARGCGYQQANVAIATMRKYQKIEKIVNNTFQNIAKEDERYAYEWLGDIKEVLEDGNDDRRNIRI